MKVCLDCNVEKSFLEFYKHSKMKDGHLNKCKSCVKKRVTIYREKNIENVKKYDQQRAILPHRVKARKMYFQTEAGKLSRKKSMIKYHAIYPIKRAAHLITSNAIRDKKLEKPLSCSKCNLTTKIEAHHDDYTKALEVRWLCNLCHNLWHKNNKPIY